MKRLISWWFAPMPAERLAALRILVGTWGAIYVAVRFPELLAMARTARTHWEPVGITKLLGNPLPVWLAAAIGVATVLLLVAYAAGVAWRIVGPLGALAFLWTTSYRQSWGMLFHTDNLLALHCLALAATPAADTWAYARPPAEPAAAGYGWGVKLLATITVATYMLAGIAKVRIGGFGWVDGEVLRNHIAVDNLRKVLLGDRIAPFAATFLEHPQAFTAFSLMSIGLELGAPIALLGGRTARVWALGAWGFHLGVILLMNVWFLYPLTGMAFAPLLAPERFVGWVKERVARLLRA